ncbi:hypothetical protein CC85DRAFT_282093 [Cutaneotrichosporon oleaginosum]|uniref:Uncharacterized protein n=1 Tax=Cutaneotrichosporon oleaginosum TaxID=879819 RepID=A0A0J0XY23_9TREE|nr:uncharacterized protein CC85DRAFT_282093 [Cutaneotrichosporon oleaginosum]KLT45952.1 hypothetical protein CC85DRAFT_282093 [Cutaneotrichosporon oleaginosum]TXT06649.1 hypothetical protein COLE_05980 [Cutaneotrichosporon oleaginosum]
MSADGALRRGPVTPRVAYNPFAENAEAGPSRPRRIQNIYSPSKSVELANNGDELLDHKSATSEASDAYDVDVNLSDEDDSHAGHDYGASSRSHRLSDEHASRGNGSTPPNHDAGTPGNVAGSPPKKQDKKRRRRRTRPPKPLEWKEARHIPGMKWYEAEFASHVRQVKRHFLTVTDERRTVPTWRPSTYHPHGTLWTPEEKGLFFASLPRHSGLRPDLIARDIGSKTETEVAQLIECLAACAEARSMRTRLSEESKEWRFHLLGSGAYEAPTDIVEREDHLAWPLELLELREEEMKREDLPLLDVRSPGQVTHDMRVAVEKWGEDFTPDKMGLTAELLWHTSNHNEELQPLEGNTELSAIERDDKVIELISAIPRRDRTPAQRETYALMTNRRHMRQKYRRKRLHAQGWTDEQIDACGGPDVAFTDRGPRGARRKYKDVKIEDGDPALAEAQEMGLHIYLEERGWEVFEFDRMREIIELYQEAHGVAPASHTEGASVTTLARNTSFAVLQPLYNILREYVRELIKHSYIIATAANPNNMQIEKWHIEAILEPLGKPRKQLRDVVSRLQRVSQMARDREAAVNLAVDPPSLQDSEDDEPDVIPAFNNDVPSRKRRCIDTAELGITPAPPLVVDPPVDSDIWMPTQTVTDEEDSELDELLSAADTALDEVMACQLRSAVSSNTVMRLNDRAWLDTPYGRPIGWLKARGLGSVPEAVQNKLTEAQNAYRERKAEVWKARRKRHQMTARSIYYPRSQAEAAAARQRGRGAVPLHVLADDWIDDNDHGEEQDAEDDESPDDETYRSRSRRVSSRTPRRKRRRGADSSESELVDMEDSRSRRKTRTPSHQKRRRRADSSENEEWEASGDSSAPMSTDEDAPARASGRPMIDLSDDSEVELESRNAEGGKEHPAEEDGLDDNDKEEEDAEEGEMVKTERMEVYDELPFEVLGGDDALASDDEAHEAPIHIDVEDELVGGDDALDSDDESGIYRRNQTTDDNADEKGGESDGDNKSEQNAPDHKLDEVESAHEMAAADNDQAEDNEKADTMVDADSNSSVQLIGGDDAIDSDSDDHYSPIPNGLAPSTVSPKSTEQLHSSSSPQRSSNHIEVAPRSSSVTHVIAKPGVHDLGHDSNLDDHITGADPRSRPTQDLSSSKLERSGSVGLDNVWARGDDIASEGWLLGGDDALDSDHD